MVENVNNNSSGKSGKQPDEKVESQSKTMPQKKAGTNHIKPRSKGLVLFLRILVVVGGLIVVYVIGLGLSFSTCFTIKGPPPPECEAVQFVTLFLMPAASLFYLVPLAKKIK